MGAGSKRKQEPITFRETSRSMYKIFSGKGWLKKLMEMEAPFDGLLTKNNAFYQTAPLLNAATQLNSRNIFWRG